ncbi:hypothetical protein DV532_10330 [Pseudomonas sp. Leaf58]|nr:hypothetical protein DV532_10330 [Pseudomonas sp. Leaf58]
MNLKHHGLYRPLRGHARSHRGSTGLEGSGMPVGARGPAKRPAAPRWLLVLIASAIIPNVMVSPIISAMPYTVSLAHAVIRFVIRFVVGLMVGFVVGAIISTIAPAATLAGASMPTAIAAVSAAAAATTMATAA